MFKVTVHGAVSVWKTAVEVGSAFCAFAEFLKTASVINRGGLDVMSGSVVNLIAGVRLDTSTLKGGMATSGEIIESTGIEYSSGECVKDDKARNDTHMTA